MLGLYYGDIRRDAERARKCLEKAVLLEPSNTEFGERLASVLVAAGLDEALLRICKSITEQELPGVTWAWLQLGLVYLRRKQAAEAVNCLQRVLRDRPTSVRVLELLGSAYIARGSYMAALKVFTRAYNLEPSNYHALFQIAQIKRTLGLGCEAVALYQEVLQHEPTLLTAWYGMAQAWYDMASQQLDDNLLASIIGSTNAGLAALAAGVAQGSSYLAFWKLVGDMCCLVHALPSDLAQQVMLPAALAAATDAAGPTTPLAFSAVAYRRCLQGAPEAAERWFDLAVSYDFQAVDAESNAQGLLFTQALAAIKEAITLDVSNASYWQALGVIAIHMGDDCVAQHALVTATKLDDTLAQTWVGLGALYLSHGDVELAHEAFSVAQSLQPGLSLAWIGQAYVAEQMSHTEALDLFRHAFELHPHSAASLGLGYHVVASSVTVAVGPVADTLGAPSSSLIPEVHERHYIHQGSVALAHYVSSRVGAQDSTAHNLYGLLLEQKGLLLDAISHFERSIALLVAVEEGLERVNLVRQNLAHALVASNQPVAAMAIFQEHLQAHPTFARWCNYAHAAFLASEFMASYQGYEQALLLGAISPQSTAEVHLSMACVAYCLQQLEAAKALLFQAVAAPQLCPPSLVVLCAFGLLTNDATLATAAWAEFPKLQTLDGTFQTSSVRDKYLLLSYMFNAQHSRLQAANALAKVFLMRH